MPGTDLSKIRTNLRSGVSILRAQDYNAVAEIAVATRKTLVQNGILTADGGVHTRSKLPSNNSGNYEAKTQEAAQDDAYISVKLLDSGGTETGSAFDAKCLFTDNATKATDCIPLVKTDKVVIVSKINDTWYIINPTFAYMPECV